jgi:succinate dehydrogenase/fumarate reductase-like Fe-S protein
MSRTMNLVLNVWRQKGPKEPGGFVRYEAKAINDHMSFLEMLDVVNEALAQKGEAPIAFDHDCREGICGACGMVINGVPHGPAKSTTTCQLHMRSFNDGDEITIEPWRAAAFPVVRDLVVDRRARSQLGTGAQARFGRGLRGRGLHRLRRLRSSLPERLCCLVHCCQNFAPGAAAARCAGTR